MQLLRVELKGFKSFADKTTVHISPGMTAIVGPNGSGKSNITDAIRWVLGESNIRNLRGQKAEDIIFAGTEKRKPMGAAEVTLLFDNTDHQLDDTLAEVAITRRIYRTGESEFFINKRSCRLKDIHLLLADTGLGRDSMAIIGQNRVDAILNSKPEERRLIFEDVAGISRFKLNKEDALRRIHATERNMERVNDLLAALKEQLEPLAEKAEKTRQYMSLAREKREYDGALAFHGFKTAERILTRLENEHIALTDEDIELQTELAQLEGQRQQLQLNLGERQADLQACEEKYTNAQRTEERLKGQISLLEEQQRSQIRERDDIKGRLEELQASEEADKQQIVLLEKLNADTSLVLAEKQEQVNVEEEAFNACRQETATMQNRLQEQQSLTISRQEEQLTLTAQLERAKSEFSSNEWRRKELDQELALLASEIKEALQVVQQLESEYAKEQTQYQELSKQKEQFIKELEQQEHQIGTIQNKKATALQNKQQLEGRLQLLLQWEEQHEGYLESTKSVLEARETWRSGIKGAVGDLFSIADTYVVAIETALGGSINHLITNTSKEAAGAVTYLKQIKGGRATFLPLEVVKGQKIDTPALKEEGVIGRAVDCITFEPMYEGIFSYLLGRTLVVDSMERGIALQKKYKQQLRLVTLSGEQLNPGGSLTGGSFKRKRASVLSRREERGQLEKELTQCVADLQRWEDVLASEVLQLTQLKESSQVAIYALHQQQELVITSETRLKAAQERWERKQRIHQETIDKLDSLQLDFVTNQDLITELQAKMAQISSLEEETSNQNELLAEWQQLQEKQQAQYEVFTAIRLEVEQLEKEMASRQEDIRSRQENLLQYGTRLAPLQENYQRIIEALAKGLPEEIKTIQQQLIDISNDIARLQEDRQKGYETNRADQTALEEINGRQQEVGNRQKVVQRRLIEMEGKLAKNRFDTETALAQLSELGYTKSEAQNLHLDGSTQDWKSKQADLLAQIAELGTINPNAITEYEEALERHDFLEGQNKDLAEAKGHLEDVIDEMDSAMSKQLTSVLDEISVRFQHIFEQLFGGGSAQIVLTEPNNILASGIDLYIQPPGKKRQQLTLLSGGERALTVIALLFSFLDYRPAPFCVLDEVDAALDEANVERFSRYLNQLGSQTQFIVVSHRKRTMEAAEVLQGVTMVERGISRLLTVSFEDVKEDM